MLSQPYNPKTDKEIKSELDDHIGYDKHTSSGNPNSGNGTTNALSSTRYTSSTVGHLRSQARKKSNLLYINGIQNFILVIPGHEHTRNR